MEVQQIYELRDDGRYSGLNGDYAAAQRGWCASLRVRIASRISRLIPRSLAHSSLSSSFLGSSLRLRFEGLPTGETEGLSP